jgi:HD-like signal output (HDOD) protein
VPAEAFAAALLHDIGKLILDRFLTADDAVKIREACETGNRSRRDAERSVLRIDHSELGGLVAERWNLPARIVAGVRYHHAPGESNDTTAYVVYVANLIAKAVAREEAHDVFDPSDPAGEAALARLSLRPEMLPKLCAAVGEDIRAVADRFA